MSSFLDSHPSPANYSLDTEFSAGRSYDPVLALVQLAIGTDIALIDPFTVDLTLLSPLFSSASLAIMHAAEQDLDLLGRAVQRRPEHLFDTQVAAQLLGHPSPSLAVSVRRLGVALDKTQRLTNWLARPLSPSVLHYAASDVAHLEELADLYAGLLDAQSRRSWLDEEMSAALARPLIERVADQAWWKLSGALVATRAQQAVLQSLGAMRDSIARASNIPPSHVAPDAALVALSRSTSPTKHLSALDAVPKTYLSALTSAARSPAQDLVLPDALPLSANDERRVLVLASYAHQVATDMSIDRNILAMKTDLTAYLQHQPSRLASQWRRSIITNDIDALLAGTATLSLHPTVSIIRSGVSEQAGPLD